MQIMSIVFGFPTKFTEYNPMHQKIVQFFRTCSCIGSAELVPIVRDVMRAFDRAVVSDVPNQSVSIALL